MYLVKIRTIWEYMLKQLIIINLKKEYLIVYYLNALKIHRYYKNIKSKIKKMTIKINIKLKISFSNKCNIKKIV
jgi:hypothetical protein